MAKTKTPYLNQNTVHPESIGLLVEQVRQLSSSDTLIRVRTDNTAKSVISFTANWIMPTPTPNRRRVFLETKLVDDVKHRLIFCGDMFQEDPPTFEYDIAHLANLPRDVMRYLRNGTFEQH